VPLIVTAAQARGGGRPAAAVLLPTFSYLAYANEHASWEHPIKSSAAEAAALPVTDRDRFMARHRLLSLYERHADGSGTCLSSWRRPVLNMRPGYHLPLVRGPHQFSADLELLHWLERREVAVDVITDDDLHRRGAAALAPYRVILTGSHPEYTSTQMLDGLEGYLDSGGRLMYLGGNGFYWVTAAPEDDPYVIEVRRGLAGTRVWESPPGECYHAMTGERGGLWRLRGRAPQALTGVGFTAQGFDVSLPYRVEAGAAGGRAGFILAGLDADAPLGGGGSVLGGPAGFEIDRADAALGTPSGAVLVASANGFSDGYQGAVEDITTADSRQGGTVSELVRSDVVFFETPAGGGVFATGSIAWCGALETGGEETPVGRITGNVLSRFLDQAPFDYDAGHSAAALPALRESPVRSVVNISSSSGTLHRVGQSVYGMTKSALDYLTRTLAGELAPLGVRVNGIAPGPVDTPIHATWADDLDAAYRWLSSQVPLGRIAEPEEIARWIVLLLNPVASFMTGAVIPLDGGQVIDRE
jgi:N,N-dimethylformamidase